MTRRRKTILIGLILALIGAVALGAFMKSRSAKKPETVATLQFRADEVTQPTLEALVQTFEVTGTITSPDTTVLKARASGQLTALLVQEGDAIEKGQPLAELDLTELSGRLQEREASLAAARANFAQVKIQWEANQKLVQKGFISPAGAELSRANFESAQAQLRSAETLRDTAKMQLRDAQILSPIRGVVAKRHAVVGEKLSFDQPVLTVTNLQRLEVTTLVSAQDSTWLKPNQAANFQVDGLTKPLKARLSRILPTADMSARAVPAIWSIEPGQGLVRPGQLASSFLEYKDSKPALTLPAEAIREEGGKQLVWMIEEGKLKTRLVVLGGKSRDGKRVAVVQGLKENDQVLSQRFDALKEGQPVAVLKAAQ